MLQLSSHEIEQYTHSPVHYAVARHDYGALRSVLSELPPLPKAGEVVTEEESITAEAAADKVSSILDRRDVPKRETPLHLAVRLRDAISVEMLMSAGADWSLQNEQGWSALQEAVCAREEGISRIITRYYQPLAWDKWCRRLPRITGTMRRMRDLYMEITFNFESSVIPFISRIAPSDTYRIWKRGSNLRADMTLAGFDGFKIHRSDQTFLFLGEGTEDGKVRPGSLLVLNHKEKEVTNALEGAGEKPSEAEIAQEVAVMSQTNMYRPSIDVTQAELVPQLTWRWQEKIETVGHWKAKIFEMHHVHISVRSRRVPGALTDEELFVAESEAQAELEDDYSDLLTEDEKQQLENVLSMEGLTLCEDDDSGDGSRPNSQADGKIGAKHHSDLDEDEVATISPRHYQNGSLDPDPSTKRDQRRGWFGWVRKRGKGQGIQAKNGTVLRPHVSTGSEEADSSSLAGPDGLTKPGSAEAAERINLSPGMANDSTCDEVSVRKSKDVSAKRGSAESNKQMQSSGSNGITESEYKKGLRPVLWLTPDFPLKMEELLPLLDILADKVKAVRRLRELLMTKLPPGTFPVKVAIPIIPTIRVIVTFNKFEELVASDEFATPLSSPTHFPESKGKDDSNSQSSSWLSWIRGSRNESANASSIHQDYVEDFDPFAIPSDYTWIDMKEKKRRLKAKKSKIQKNKKVSSKPVEALAGIERVE